MLVRYCAAVALKRRERVNAFNLVIIAFAALISSALLLTLHYLSSGHRTTDDLMTIK